MSGSSPPPVVAPADAGPGVGRRAARGFVWVALENVARQVLGLGVFLLLARLLGPNDFGLVALATAVIAIVQLLVELGLSEAIVQRREEDLDNLHLDSAFWAGLAVAGVLCATVLAAAAPVAALAGHPELAPLLRALAPLPLLTALATVPQAILVRRMQFRSLSLRTVIALVAGGATGVGIALAGGGPWSLVAQQVVMAAVSVVVVWHAVDWRPRRRFSPPRLWSLFAFGGRVLGLRAIDLVNRKGDDLLVGFVLGPVALGCYALAYQVLLAAEQLLSRGFDVLSLTLLSRRQDDDQAVAGMLGRITLLAGIAAFPCFLGLAAVAPAAIELAFGPEWSAAVPVVQVLALVGLLHVLFQGNHAVFKAKGRPDLSLKLAGLNAAANLALLLLVVRHGVLAVAVAYTLRAYLLAPVGLLMLRRLTGQDPLAHLRPLLPAAVAALVMASCVAGLIEWAGPRWSAATLLPAAIVAGAATYLLLLRCLAPQLVRELLAGGRALLSKQPTVVTAA